MKTEFYHLIILDESGSMGGVVPQTISGCNETIDTIRAAQEQFGDEQDHFVSIYAFQDGGAPSRYIIKNVPVMKVDHISERDYRPGGMTPLYDAVGSTLVDLKMVVKDKKLAIGNVTIITDGLENSSRQYTLQKVSAMIDGLKEIGWSFNFIGANIDVQATASRLHIDNSLEFQQDTEGMQNMFASERKSRMAWSRRIDRLAKEIDMEQCASSEKESKVLHGRLRDAAANYFTRTDEDDECID